MRPRDAFGADLASSARALVSQPAVPLVSLGASLLLTVGPATSGHEPVVRSLAAQVVFFATQFFLLGWYGAERIFFQRHLEGKPVALRHLLGLVKTFVGRFFAVGLLCVVLFSAFFFVAFEVHGPGSGPMPVWFPLGFCALLVAMDFALTFVTPALAYTTRSAQRALWIGAAMIGQTWPRCALYVLCPPLALNVLNVIYPVSASPVRFALSVALALLGLLAKGAIAAFYLRERGSYSVDGAAHITAEREFARP